MGAIQVSMSYLRAKLVLRELTAVHALEVSQIDAMPTPFFGHVHFTLCGVEWRCRNDMFEGATLKNEVYFKQLENLELCRLPLIVTRECFSV